MKKRFLPSLVKLSQDKTTFISGIIIIIFLFVSILAPLISPHDPKDANLNKRLQPPVWSDSGGWDHILGCDHMGRDILSRIIYGSRVSIFVGISVMLVSAIIGIALGLVAGYRGGWIDSILSAIVDIILAFPLLIFAIALMAITGPGLKNMIMALAYKEWVRFYRLVRGDVLLAKNMEYTESARALGAKDLYIMFRHILPNVFTPVLVLGTLGIANVILMEASLSFLGLGIQPPSPAWGLMVNEGRQYIMTSWWLSTFPGLAIVILILTLNLFGQGLRDAFDPRLSQEE